MWYRNIVKTSIFDTVTYCPICESQNVKTHFQRPYDGEEMTSYLSSYYEGRVDLSLFIGESFLINYCESCDFYWQQNVLTEEYAEILYTEWGSLEKSREKQKTKKRKKKINKLLILNNLLNALNLNNPDLRILDFGGGWSTFAQAAVYLGYEAFLLETSEEKREFARSKGVQVIHSMDEVEESFFDLIILNQVLEHIPFPKTILESLYPENQKRGGLYVAVPQVDPDEPIIAKGSFEPLEHINSFTPTSLIKILKTTGYDPVGVASSYSALDRETLTRTLVRNAKTQFLPESKKFFHTLQLARKP